MIDRKPSHFGSYRKGPGCGRSSASLASIGSTGGAMGNSGSACFGTMSILLALVRLHRNGHTQGIRKRIREAARTALFSAQDVLREVRKRQAAGCVPPDTEEGRCASSSGK